MDITREIQESLMNAMQRSSSKAIMSSNSSCTLDCDIIEVVDAANGEYKIKVNNNILTAYSQPSAAYQPGDLVLVLFPNGNNWSDKKAIILNAVSPSAQMFVEEETDSYIDASENLIEYSDQIELCTLSSSTKKLEEIGSNFNTLFTDYISNYKILKFSVSIKTDIQPVEQQSNNGLYGIGLQLPIKIDDGNNKKIKKLYEMWIDTKNIQGNPYNLESWSDQEIYITLPDDLEYDIEETPNLIAYVSDFMQAEDKENDIFIKNINFKAVKEIPEEYKTGNYLTLVTTTGGSIFLNEYDEKTIIPVLKVNGRDKKVNDYECYLFRENVNIKPGSQRYCNFGGSGLECLNDFAIVSTNEENQNVIQLVTNNYELNVSAKEVYSSIKYKCILINNETNSSGVAINNKLITGYITLKNMFRNIDYQLVTTTGDTSYSNNIGNISLIARINPSNITGLISTSWQRYDENDNIIEGDFYTIVRENDKQGNYLETEITFPTAIVTNRNFIRCSFYRQYADTITGEVKNDLIGTAQILVDTLGQFTYKVIIDNSNVLYKYDADGDSPFIADYDGPLSTRNQKIEPLRYRVFKADGTELTEKEYEYCTATLIIPDTTKSMFVLKDTTGAIHKNGYYYIEDRKIIEYDIATRYNSQALDNDISIIIEYDGVELKEETDIRFLKDGESGTNGSKYAGVIVLRQGSETEKAYAYGEKDTNGIVRKLQLVYIKDDGLYLVNRIDESKNALIPYSPNEQTLSVQAYSDGELLDASNYSIDLSIFDSSATNPIINITNGGTVLIEAGKTLDGVTDTSNIVQAKVVIKSIDNVNMDEVLYIYYPIEISYVEDTLFNNAIPNICNGFDKVLYSSNGNNPQYNNVNDFIYMDDINDDDLSSYNEYTLEYKGSLQSTDDSNKKRTFKLKPSSTFSNGVSLNYVKVEMKNTKAQEAIKAEENIKNNYLNNTILPLINKQFKIQEDLTKLRKDWLIDYYNNLNNNLNESEIFILQRASLYDNLNNALVELNNFKNYCTAIDIKSFDYNELCDNNIDIIASQINILVDIGNDSEPSSLVDNLNNCLINFNEFEYPNVDPVTRNSLIIALNNYNEYIMNYNNTIQIFKENNEGFDSWNEFKERLDSYINLSYLTDEYIGAEEDYINLHELLTQLRLNLYNSKALIYIYSDIQEKINDKLDELIINYTDENHIQNYINKQKELEDEMEELKKELRNLKKEEQVAGSNSSIIHLKPIIMLYNRYERSNINELDGNKIYTGNNDNYILAPQMGAGIKEKGKFTGLIMGISSSNENTTDKRIGLIGLSEGIESLFLNAKDGSATFGMPGQGQIKILPISEDKKIKALIQGGNYDTVAGTGMQIDLAAPSIYFGSKKFFVTPEGKMTAQGGGSIAGLEIGNTQLFKNKLYLDAGTLHDATETEEAYTSYGIYSEKHDKLNRTSKGFYLGNDGLSISNSIRISALENGQIEIGRLSGNHLIISGGSSGDKTYSYIAFGSNQEYKEADSDTDNTNKVYIGTNGISLGKRFSVSEKGKLTAYSGVIGGLKISKSELKSNDEKIKISASGSIEGNYVENSTGLKIDSLGNAYFNKIIANKSGSIGGLDINATGLSKNNITISSEGSISNGNNLYIKSTGEAKFTNVSITGGSIILGGTTLNTSGLTMTAANTKVGTKTMDNYVGDIAAGKITATSVTAALLNANITTSGSISCGTISITSSTGSTCNGRIAFTGNGCVTIGGYKLDGSVASITEGSNTYRVFLAKDI